MEGPNGNHNTTGRNSPYAPSTNNPLRPAPGMSMTPPPPPHSTTTSIPYYPPPQHQHQHQHLQHPPPNHYHGMMAPPPPPPYYTPQPPPMMDHHSYGYVPPPYGSYHQHPHQLQHNPGVGFLPPPSASPFAPYNTPATPMMMQPSTMEAAPQAQAQGQVFPGHAPAHASPPPTTPTPTTTMTARTTTTTSTPHQGKKLVKKKRRPVEISSQRGRGRPRKRPASSQGSAAENGHTIKILDKAPDRWVNPLLELPSAASQNEPIQGSELYVPTELAFCPPDTYPLSYLARLLGFDVPVPSLEDPTVYPTPLLDMAELPLKSSSLVALGGNQDPFLEIPKQGPGIRTNHHPPHHHPSPHGRFRYSEGDMDDQHKLDYIDPVYATLLQQGFQKTLLKAANSNLATKFAAKQHLQRVTRQSVVQLAQSMRLLSSSSTSNEEKDWSFDDWTSFHSSNSTSAAAAAASSPRQGRPRWTLDGTTVYSNPPPQSFGIIACFRGEPVAMLQYKFQWYPMKHESELVMVIEGMGQRTLKASTQSSKRTSTATTATAATTTATTTATTAATTMNVLASSARPAVPTTGGGSAIACSSSDPPTTEILAASIGGTAMTAGTTAEPASTGVSGMTAGTTTDPTTAGTSANSPTAEAVGTKPRVEEERNVQEETRSLETSSDILNNNNNEPDPTSASTKDGTPLFNEGPVIESSVQETPQPEEPSIVETLPSVEINDNVRLVMISLALEHTRACDVWYSLWDVPEPTVSLNTQCFRMVQLPKTNGQSGVPMICDLKKCSSRYALLSMSQQQSESSAERDTRASTTTTTKERLLVKLPTVEEAKSCFDSKFAEMQRSKRAPAKTVSRVFAGATGRVQQVTVGVRAIIAAAGDANGSTNTKEEIVQLLKLKEDGSPGDEIQLPPNVRMDSQLDILRCFPIPTEIEEEATDNEILRELKTKQQEMLAAEKALEPRLRSLMSQVVQERLEYEQPEAKQKRAQEKLVLKENEKIVARRKEMDEEWQEQLEQDMNAVCNICNDGEVTPDNQILFCEACNVAVHQMCYGIEEVPEGDYYCIACRYFDREKMSQALAKRSGAAPRIALPPLPISCELCPIKQGAYIRTDTSKSAPNATVAKWVHMACAKWQGLHFVDKTKPEVVEDVADLKTYFRRLDCSCCLCQGKRGAYNQCRYEGCDKFLHVTCARAMMVCEVIHGEDVEGPVAENPWSLMCPDHSNIDKEELSRDPVPVEQLIRMAKEFPVEPMPEPLPQPHKPFNRLTRKERERALADPKYEADFLEELMTKKFAGVRCEVCFIVEDDGKNLSRCTPCGAVVCVSCRFSDEDIIPEQKQFTCFACRFVEQKEKAKEEYVTPQCHLCNQKGGLLLESFAKPVNRLNYWKQNPKEYKKTIFAKSLWTHYTCTFWLKGLDVDGRACKVNCSNVVMSNGKGYVRGSHRCALCGRRGGLKARCADLNCRARGERRNAYHFHVTCAREAGLEVNHDDQLESEFYVNCYFHGGNEHNLRARLEDLVEIEKRRAGKKFFRSDAAMTFADGSRILNSAILVARMLGWAWRWAEQWVEHGSNWEPLLEPGQKESKMTKEELKIVVSTPESRCADARRCRLAAFGAALRNRDYDTENGFDNEALTRALRAVLNTKSLVGPLEKFEIDFFTEWLARAYRSKSRLLGFGDDKIKVVEDAFCLHADDKSPKCILGSRPLPGKEPVVAGQVFESPVEEPDDFLKPETTSDGVPVDLPANSLKLVLKTEKKYKATPKVAEEYEMTEKKCKVTPKVVEECDVPEPPKQRGPGRPPKIKEINVSAPPISKSGPGVFSERVASVAALAPSAVKKRGPGRNPRDRSLTPAIEEQPSRKRAKLGSPSFKKREIMSSRKDQGFPVLEVEMVWDELNPDGALKKRSKGRPGRPPTVIRLALVLRIEGKDFIPDKPKGEKDSDGGGESGTEAVGPTKEFEGVQEDRAEAGILESQGGEKASLPEDTRKVELSEPREASKDSNKGDQAESNESKNAAPESEVQDLDGPDKKESAVQMEIAGEETADAEVEEKPSQDEQIDVKEKQSVNVDESTPPTPSPRRKRGRPFKNSVGRPKKQAATEIDIKVEETTTPSSRPRRARRAVMGLDAMNSTGRVEAKDEMSPMRRSGRQSTAKEISLEEPGSFSDLDENLDVEKGVARGGRKNKRVSSRGPSSRKGGAEPELDRSDEAPKKKRRGRLPGKKTKQEEHKSDEDEAVHGEREENFEEELALFSDEDEDEDEDDDEDTDPDYPGITSSSSSHWSSRKRSGLSTDNPRLRQRTLRQSNPHSAGHEKDSDPEDSLPLSAVIESTRANNPSPSDADSDEKAGDSSEEDNRDTEGDEQAEGVESKEESADVDGDGTKESTDKSTEVSGTPQAPQADEAKPLEEDGEAKAIPPASTSQDEEEDTPKRRGRSKGKQEASRNIVYSSSKPSRRSIL